MTMAVGGLLDMARSINPVTAPEAMLVPGNGLNMRTTTPRDPMRLECKTFKKIKTFLFCHVPFVSNGSIGGRKGEQGDTRTVAEGRHKNSGRREEATEAAAGVVQ